MENNGDKMSKKPNILLISLPYQGHISPMMQFAKRLTSKGVRVTIITPFSANLISDIQNKSINIEYVSYDHDEDQNIITVEAYMENIEKKASDKLLEVMEKQKSSSGEPFDVLVHDSLLPWGVDFGHQHGLKTAIFFTQPCAISAIYYLVHQGKIKYPVQEGDDLSFLPDQIPISHVKDLPYDLYHERYAGTLDMLGGQFSNVENADWIFFNTFLGLEDEVVDWLSSKWKIMTIGPSVPSMFLDKRLADDKDYGLSLFKPDGEECIKWLDGKDTDSVVYVSFGSLANLVEDHMEEIAWGLLNSKCSFIWVVRDTEKSKLSEKFLEESADRGLIVNWCPQLEVLAHKAVGSFMTHCGWNSTLEALCLGVPMMVMPQWTDQTTNAKYIVDVWQTGVRVKAHDKESITREDITKSVKDVMEGAKREELKANALKLKDMALEAMSEGGSSDKNIDDFISNIVTPTTST
ncbi:Glycosyltransferase [Heracleum sosnowskyi]|uniref:Glycosyltransferase n=1 Tax=Heracleum sosnowskyi TaxID=360622 RepID=A0AAD8MZH7_9APIA|nr:Glycosyltransferase [Heracleum sosnowskyi]